MTDPAFTESPDAPGVACRRCGAPAHFLCQRRRRRPKTGFYASRFMHDERREAMYHEEEKLQEEFRQYVQQYMATVREERKGR